MCPLVIELQKRSGIKCVTCLTGQHKEMLRQVMEVFHIEEDYNLDIMKSEQTLSSITVDVIAGFSDILKLEKPDLVLVHGDTTTSFAAALSSFYFKIPVGHVEAGLRTYNLDSPYPEEFNRQTVDLVSKLYFAPTETAKRNLINEGKSENRICVTGNTVIDALNYTIKESYDHEYLKWAEGSRLILLTTHRRENLGDPMRNIFRALLRVVEDHMDVKVIFPIHKNPQIRRIADEFLQGIERIKVIEPLDVLDFHNFMSKCYLILTDSGGIQEEAPSLGIPVLVLRDETERPEGVEAGTLKLVGTEENMIYHTTTKLLTDHGLYHEMSRAINPYGDGNAAQRIADSIIEQEWRE